MTSFTSEKGYEFTLDQNVPPQFRVIETDHPAEGFDPYGKDPNGKSVVTTLLEKTLEKFSNCYPSISSTGYVLCILGYSYYEAESLGSAGLYQPLYALSSNAGKLCFVAEHLEDRRHDGCESVMTEICYAAGIMSP